MLLLWKLIFILLSSFGTFLNPNVNIEAKTFQLLIICYCQDVYSDQAHGAHYEFKRTTGLKNTYHLFPV